MNDLEDKIPQSPSERKFNFRFGRSGHHSTQNNEPEREQSTGNYIINYLIENNNH